MSLGLRNLLHEPLRLALSITAVALAIMLILLLGGLSTGMYRQISAYLDHSPASVVVTQTGVVNLLGATSLLPPGTVEAAQAVAPDAAIVPILSQFIVLDLHGRKQPVYLIGYQAERGGGPWALARGTVPKTDREIIFDRILAERHNLAVGDTIDVMGLPLTISGLSTGTSSWMTSFVFVGIETANKLLGTSDATSLLLVTPAEGDSPRAVVNQLAGIPGTEILLKQDLIDNDVRLIAKVFSLPIRLMVSIAFVVGTLVVGLVIYAATVERQREYGVLKAIGARPAVLYRVVTVQALVVAGLGATVAVVLTQLVGLLIMQLRPQFLVVLEPSDVVKAFASAALLALLAALFPARAIASLAPADVFRR